VKIKDRVNNLNRMVKL